MMKIEKNIPVPEDANGKQKYPFHQMEVGDSVFFDETHQRARISSCTTYHKKRTGKKFTIRKVDGGFRVWRIA